MADKAKIGTNWQDDELDAIVADYFAMLEADSEKLFGFSRVVAKKGDNDWVFGNAAG